MRTPHALWIALLAAVVCADRHHRRSHTKSEVKNFNNAERDPEFWTNEAQAGINKRLNELMNNKVARNVIMFLGDGMSVQTLMAARTLKGQRENRTGEEAELFFESFPTVGLAKTYCLDEQIPDSACTATAYLSGVKNNDGTILVNGHVQRQDCVASMDPANQLDSIASWAIADGRDAGIVTTTRVTHASPAGTYARTSERYWENDAEMALDGADPNVCPDIAQQLVYTSPANQFKVILGGGRQNLRPANYIDEEGDPGIRLDGRDLIQEWQNEKQARGLDFKYVWNRSELMSLRDSPPDYLLGLFEADHMQYHLEADPITEPTLAELTEVAIKSLERNEKGYFLFVEGGRIDHAHHFNWHHLALDETIEFDKAVEKAVEMVGDDTLIVVTADHAHAMTVNGYSQRGNSIIGPSNEVGDDNVPYMTLSYANGPGARTHVNGIRPDVTQDEDFLQDVRWMTHAEVIIDSETHGGDDVAVLAYGPHHHMFSGLYEQSQVPWRMAFAACIGPGLNSEYCNSATILYNPLNMLYVIALTIFLHAFQR